MAGVVPAKAGIYIWWQFGFRYNFAKKAG